VSQPKFIAHFIRKASVVAQKNHGRNFWILLDNVTGNARGLDKQLKKFNLKNW